ncbi:MAG TPA: hypothetical protein VII93_03885 [Anaerolineales bacterium]
MTENYDQKKARQLRIRETLPAELKEIPLCYVEDVAEISPQAKQTLIDALAKGPINIACALEYFQNTFVLNADDLLEVAKPKKRGPLQAEGDQDQQKEAAVVPCNAPSADSSPAIPPTATLDPRDIHTLTEILIKCYPSMPVSSAGGLAKSEVMREAIRVVEAVRLALESSHAKSDFVILTLFGLFRTTKAQLQEIVQGNPVYLQAIKQSGITLE